MLISNSFGLQARAKNFIHIDTTDDLSALETIAVSYTHLRAHET